MDNGPEFIRDGLDAWAYERACGGLHPPGKPNENAFIESFNGRLREECLNDNQFLTIVEAWRKDYTEERPHSRPTNLLNGTRS